jgi:hypothetical protein
MPVLALSVVARRSASASSVTFRVGRRRGRPSEGLWIDEEIGAGFGPLVVWAGMGVLAEGEGGGEAERGDEVSAMLVF